MNELNNGVINVKKRDLHKYFQTKKSERYMIDTNGVIDKEENWLERAKNERVCFEFMCYVGKNGDFIFNKKKWKEYKKIKKEDRFMRHRYSGWITSEAQWEKDIEEKFLNCYSDTLAIEEWWYLSYVTKDGSNIYTY